MTTEEANIFENGINNLKRIKQSGTSETALEKSRFAVRGSIAGLVIGLMAGYYFKQNIYIAGVLGAVAGGAINYFFVDKMSEL